MKNSRNKSQQKKPFDQQSSRKLAKQQELDKMNAEDSNEDDMEINQKEVEVDIIEQSSYNSDITSD